MKLIHSFYFFSIIVIIFCSCKKSDSNQTPDPAPRPDTLTSGWTKITVEPGLISNQGGDIFFRNSMEGYLSFSNGYTYISLNGGNSWNKSLNFSASNMAVTSDNKAFFINNYANTIYRTVDGGANVTNHPVSANNLKDIFFADINIGLCSTSDGLFNTTNGGNTWTNIAPLADVGNSSSSIFMFNNSTAWVVYGRKVVHANGNFNNWQTDTVTTNVAGLGLISVFATSASVVYSSSFSGYLFKSTNGGVSFSLINKFDDVFVSGSNRFSDLHFVDANIGYISTGSRIYKTTDAGNTWSVIVALGNTNIIEIHFTDATHGWAICYDGTILKFS